MISSTTWSLTEMCYTHLNHTNRIDIDPDDVADYLDGNLSKPDKMLNFVEHCALDSHFLMALAHSVQILPLTRELTKLAGNAW
jgi:DNA polymerase alpha subunit A